MTYCTMFKEDDVFKETFMVNDLSTYIYIKPIEICANTH